jgi:WD40 repeat protein
MGVGPWQKVEYYNAFDRHVREPSFPLIPVVTADAQAPGLPLLRSLNWVEAAQVADDTDLHRIVAALKGDAVATATPLWKLVNPYRGLEAMTEDNADYFYGRNTETMSVLKTLTSKPGRCPILIGGSGLGKSSVAQAGVLSALKSMRLPGATSPGWPAKLANSRNWLQLTMRPGEAPLAALAVAVTRAWRLDSRDPDQAALPRKWAKSLMSGGNTLGDLISATQEELKKQQGEAPAHILLYVDQGEELYTRASIAEARRFSEVLTADLKDSRLLAFASLRADFYDKLQADQGLFSCYEHIDVAPLDRPKLDEVVTEPARALGVQFEDAGTSSRITAQASAKPSALPLLSYLMTDMWKCMVERGDRTLRLQAQAIDIGGVLASRADEFLAANPDRQEVLRHLLTLKLCAVQAQGAPVRREARRKECSEAEWILASQLADYPWRLVVTSEHEADSEMIAEVAHEALLTAWPRLEGWLRDQRDFLVFKNDAEQAEKRFQEAGKSDDALLGGLDLIRAQAWLPARSNDVGPTVAEFVNRSIAADRARKRQQRSMKRRVAAGAVATVILTILVSIATFEWRQAVEERSFAAASLKDANIAESLFLSEIGRARMAVGDFITGMLVGLAGLPDRNIDPTAAVLRPDVPEADGRVFEGYLGYWERMLLTGHQNAIRSVAVTANGKRIATSSDKNARVWDAATGNQIAVVQAGSDPFSSVAVYPDGTHIVTTSVDNSAQVWDVAATPASAAPLTGSGILGSVAVSDDGGRVAAGADDGTVTVWDASTNTRVTRLGVNGGVIAATGSEMIHVASDGAVPDGNANAINSVAINADGTRVVAGFADNTARVWDVATGATIVVLRGHTLPVTAVAISNDGGRVATGSFDETACVWEVATGAKVCAAAKLGDRVTSIAISADGKRVVTGCADNTARIWDATTGDEIKVLRGHIDSVTGVAFLPDGGIVTASEDKTARIWSPAANREIKVLDGHVGPVSSVAFSANGKLLVSGSWDKTARTWDALSGEPLKVFAEHTKEVTAVAVDSEGRDGVGKHIITGSLDGTVRVWDTDSAQCTQVECQRQNDSVGMLG